MTLKTHGVTGFAVSLATSGVYMASQAGTTDAKMHFGIACAIAIGVFAGSLYPDIDHQKSLLNGVNMAMEWEEKFARRGITHTLLNAIGVNLPFVLIWLPLLLFTPCNIKWLIAMGVSLSIGCIWHMILDSFTPKGVMWLYPLMKFRFGIPFISNYTVEKVFRFIVATSIFIVAGWQWGLVLRVFVQP